MEGNGGQALRLPCRRITPGFCDGLDFLTIRLPIEQAAINLAYAVILRSVIGFERQWCHRLAGLRPNGRINLVPGERHEAIPNVHRSGPLKTAAPQADSLR